MSEIRTDTINNASGDNDSGIDLSTNDQVSIKTANTTALTVDASQNVGIGTSSPSDKMEISQSNNTGATLGLQVHNTNTGTSGNYAGIYASAVNGLIGMRANAVQTTSLSARVQVGSTTAHPLSFVTSDTQHMLITSAGRVSIGTTTETAKVSVYQAGNSLNLMRLQNTDGGNSCTMIQFSNSASASCGLISQTGATTVAYTTSSDYRLKENVSYSFDATTRLKTLKPCRFNFIQDGTDKVVDGFLAHEVQEIVPEAIIGTKDAVDADGNPVYQGIDQSKLVPLLVKTIQELEARITALENS